MDSYRDAISNYSKNRQNQVEEALSSNEAVESAKAGLLQAKTALTENMSGERFADKLREGAAKFQSNLGIDMGAASLGPAILKKAASFALNRSKSLAEGPLWKTAAARNYAKSQGLNPDDAVDADEGTIKGFLKEGVGNLKTSISEGVENAKNYLTSKIPEEAKFLTTTDNPIYAPKSISSSFTPRSDQAEIEMGDMTSNIKGSSTTLSKRVIETPEEETGFRLPTELPEEAPAAEVADLETQGTKMATSAVDDVGNIVGDLAPEATEAASAWGAVGSVLSEAIPLVGFGLGAFTLGESIYSAVKEAKLGDPYATAEATSAAAQKKLNNLSSDISSDQFASKIGGGMPSFGSLANLPNMDTAKQMNVALHS